MNKKVKKKNPLKLKSCLVALSLWGFPPLSLSSSPVMAAETASNTTQEQEAKALLNKGGDLKNEEAIAAYNDLITRFGNSQDADIQKEVAKALANKGVDLYELHRYEEALAVNNNLITRFGNSQDADIQKEVANALFNKGSILGNLHRIGQARAEWEELVYRFKDNPDVHIQKCVKDARHNLLITRNL